MLHALWKSSLHPSIFHCLSRTKKTAAYSPTAHLPPRPALDGSQARRTLSGWPWSLLWGVELIAVQAMVKGKHKDSLTLVHYNTGQGQKDGNFIAAQTNQASEWKWDVKRQTYCRRSKNKTMNLYVWLGKKRNKAAKSSLFLCIWFFFFFFTFYH